MKTFLPLSLILGLSYSLFSQTENICIPYGSPVTIDGFVSAVEWQDADSLFLGSGNQTKVFYKHDSTSLFVAYIGNLESSTRIPEVLLDVDYDKSNNWLADDWWFHVSAQDCDYQGAYANYDSCALIRPNWSAQENMAIGPPSPPFNDTVEIQIPFSTLELDLSTTDTIGISFLVTNLFSSWIHWPLKANRNSPASWGAAVFDCDVISSLVDNNYSPVNIQLAPNPSLGTLRLSFSKSFPLGPYAISVVNLRGQTVWQKDVTSFFAPFLDFQFVDVENGLYFLLIEGQDFLLQEKFILAR